MVVLQTAVLSFLIPSAVLARGINHEKFHKRAMVAPYPANNSTTSAAPLVTAAPTLTKTINVVPVPASSSQAGNSPAQGGSNGNSNGNGNGNKAAAPAGASAQASQCGPPTVTVTVTANTVTVTAGGAPASSTSTSTTALAAPVSSPAAQPKVQVSPQQSNTQGKAAAPKVAEKLQQPATNSQPSSSAQPQSSSSPKTATNGKKKGLLYADIQTINSMGGGLGWGCNWDSSPIPAVGQASGTLSNGMMFVPQLWGPQDVHTGVWAGNSKGAPYVMAFNEPNQPQSSGGCGPMNPGDAVAPYEANMKANKDAGQKIISPCVSNDASAWIDSFLSATSLKPDCLCVHWYGVDLQGLQGTIATFAAIQSKYGIAELWLTEFALNVDIGSSAASELFQWLENQSGVNYYAYNNHNLATTPGVQSAYCS